MKTGKKTTLSVKIACIMAILIVFGSNCFATTSSTGLSGFGSLLNILLAAITSMYVKGLVAIVCGGTAIIALVNKGDQQLFMKYGKIAICCALILSCQWMAGLFFDSKDTGSGYTMTPDYSKLK